MDTSFVEPKYKYAYTDLLYTVPHREGGHVHLYFLVEHKSYLARQVPLQILSNILDVFHSYETLSPVIPLLLYHGTDEWTVPDNFHDYLELKPSIRQDFGEFIPQYRYLPILIRQDYLPENIQEAPIRVFFRALIIYNAKNQFELALEFVEDIIIYTKDDEGLVYFNLLLEYIFIVFNDRLEEFYLEVEKRMGKAVMELVMTAGQKMVYEGTLKGREEGREEGILQVARKLLREKVDKAFIMRTTGLSSAELKQAGIKVEKKT